jgi:hypothetical protein
MTGMSPNHVIGGAELAAGLDASRAIRQASEATRGPSTRRIPPELT